MPTKSEYRAYIGSEAWQQRRKKFLQRNYLCARCRLHRALAVIAYDQDLHVHHRNYANVGAELDADLEPLCKRCHEIETFGRTELHEICGLSDPDFYKNLWMNLGPTMVLALAEKKENPLTAFVSGSREAIMQIAWTIRTFLRASKLPDVDQTVDDFLMETLIEARDS